MLSFFEPLRYLTMLYRERAATEALVRKPLAKPVVDQASRVRALHEGGAEAGPLEPFHQFNAQVISGLVPNGGRILDLGCGSGRSLSFLAKRRPDVSFIGLELSKPLIKLGRTTLQNTRLGNRILLREGPMCEAHNLVPEKVELITSTLSTHRLRKLEDLRAMLTSMRILKFRNNCSVWLFDFSRPSHEKVPDSFVDFFLPAADKELKNEIRESIRAAFSYEELSEMLDQMGIGPFEHFRSKRLPIFQAHCLRSEKHFEVTKTFWQPQPLAKVAERRYRFLKASFPSKVFP